MRTATHDIVVVGASAGGVEALTDFVSALPQDLPAAVFVVVHVSSTGTSLPQILSRSGALPAAHPRDGERIEEGRIYVAPPDAHLLLESGLMRLDRGPQHNRHRPAVDPLFWSAARAYGPRVVGIVMSGMLDDGTSGLLAIRRTGGVTVVQDPDTTLFPGMPQSALALVEVDHVLPPRGIGELVGRLALEPVAIPGPDAQPEAGPLLTSMARTSERNQIGKPSTFTCPDCGGALWELDQEGVLQFHCRIGHTYSSEGLLDGKTISLEASLWAAVRALEEDAALSLKLAGRLKPESLAHRRLETRARESTDHAQRLRALVEQTRAQAPDSN